MERSDDVRPLVIKRKKVVAAGHHGGAWKVAYADFVTAMMAFFLMMWLLGSVDSDKRRGIADYFSDTYAIDSHSAGAEQILGGESLSQIESITDEIATRAQSDTDATELEDLAAALEQAARDIEMSDAFAHMTLRMTDEGLVVELFDLDHASLFVAQSDEPQDVLLFLISVLADAFQTVTNPVAIGAHSRSFPSVFRENPVWPLTVNRAQAVHELMQDAGLDAPRFRRVTGHADRSLAVSDPMAARNNRVELILLHDPDAF